VGQRLRVWHNAKRHLGLRAKLERERLGAYPIVRVGGHRFAFRVHRSTGRYFRLLAPCVACGRPIPIQTYKIRRRKDIAAAVAVATQVPLRCGQCPSTELMADPADDSALTVWSPGPPP
jgi:hypothetical protein